MNHKIIRSCAFPFQYPTNGGIHRSEQLTEILQHNNIDITELHESKYKQARPILDRLTGSWFSLQQGDWDAFRLRRLGGIGRRYHLYKREFKNNQNYQALVWETTGEKIAPYIAPKYNIPIVALPHQLESYFHAYFWDYTKDQICDLLKKEIQSLSLCNKVFTISAEDQILLANHGVTADYLPYYPSERLINFYSQVRQQRLETKKDFFLLLGSAKNHASREGFRELSAWINATCQTNSLKVKLVGYQTESLKEVLNYSWLEIIGTVSQEQLYQYLTEAIGILIHQTKGIGVLTRIPEMLVGGIPVIANQIAARSATHYTGVHIYNSPEELSPLLQQEYSIPTSPPKPENAEKRLIDFLSNPHQSL
jgi:hypothetical protein